MAAVKQTKSLPNPVYKVKSMEGDRELRMSYGMFNDIMRMVGNSSDASTLLITDPMARDLVIRRLFTDNKQAIQSEDDLVSSFDIEIDISEMDDILVWVADHVNHFFVSTGRKMQPMLEKYRQQLPSDPSTESPSSE